MKISQKKKYVAHDGRWTIEGIKLLQEIEADILAGGGGGGGPSAWGSITGTLTDQSDLNSALNGKAATSHTHTESQITDLDKYTQAEVDSAISSITVAYNELTGIPSTFAPSVHQHTESQITDLDKYTQAEVDSAISAITFSYNNLDDVPGSFPPSGHTHTEADITDLGTYLTDAPSDGTQYARQNGAWAAVSGGGGGGSVYTLCKAKGNTGGASLDDVEAAITWAAPAITSADVSVSGSQITINTTGTYKFTVSLRTDSGNRTELFIRTYIDTGAGLTQDTDETVSNYVARDADQDTGGVVLVTAFALTATNVVEFRGFGDTDGSCIMLDPGTHILVERVA